MNTNLFYLVVTAPTPAASERMSAARQAACAGDYATAAFELRKASAGAISGAWLKAVKSLAHRYERRAKVAA